MNFPPRAISLRLPAVVDNCNFAHRVRGETYIPCEKFITAAPGRGGPASCRNNLMGRRLRTAPSLTEDSCTPIRIYRHRRMTSALC